MKIAVLSGKGGAGKTFVAVNLAVSVGHATYIDCDVEEPNGRIFLKPKNVSIRKVSSMLPTFDPLLCTGCRKCVDACRFHALVFVKGRPMVFREVCHSCGLCTLVCRANAVGSLSHDIGEIEIGTNGCTDVVTGILNPGEASGIPVIQEAIRAGQKDPVIIDCPPGSACNVNESIAYADYCIIVAEPTAFGFHNFQMVYELVLLWKKQCGVVINKMERPYAPLEEFCADHQIPVLMRIPFDPHLSELSARGIIASQSDREIKDLFRGLYNRIGGK